MKLKSVFSVFLVLTLLFSCCGCSLFGSNTVQHNTEEEQATKTPEPSLNLAALKNNAASLGLLELMKNAEANETNYNVTVVNNDNEVYELLDSGKADVATLPLISAIRYFNKGKTPIKMLYSASYMTVKMLSTKSDIRSVRDFKEQPIYIPGKYTLETSSILHLLHHQQAYYVADFTPSLKYANDAEHLLSIIDSGRADYCVASEPLATRIMDKHPDLSVQFEAKDGFADIKYFNIVQDCVIITEQYLNDHPEAVETFMTRCKTSIVYSNYNTYLAADLAELYQIAETSDLAAKMIQNSEIIFMDASIVANQNRFFFTNNTKFMPRTELFDGYPPEADFYYR